MALILLVEDQQLLRWTLTQRLTRGGHSVHEAENLAVAGEHLRLHQPDLVILDVVLPDGSGLDFLEANSERLDGSVVLVMTAFGEVHDAVRAMKLGAVDFLSKPVAHDELMRLVARSLELRNRQLDAEVAREARARDLTMDVVAHSATFQRTLEVAAQVAQSEVQTVLVQGESGTGKNLLARYIHSTSRRSSRPLLELSCASIPGSLLESELFGHERGAFTDAKATKRGTLELANNGTVVLDEIGELHLDLQAKLLHFLEERYFRRVGGVREIHVDVAVVALTNRNLREMVQSGDFREDLFYRLNVFPITVSPLRERPDDVVPLAEHFLESLRVKFGRPIDGFSADARRCLTQYLWPGNVRELRNVIERAMVLETGSQVTCRALVLDGASSPTPGDVSASVGAIPDGIVKLDTLEREMLRRAMQSADGNQTRAAEMLGLSRDQLRYRLKKLKS